MNKVHPTPHANPPHPVPLLDLEAQYSALREQLRAAILEVCDSQQFIMGPAVQELERRVADYSRTAYGIGVSSGTDAILAALMALDVGPGDEVITSTYSFFATGGVIARLGARPIFCDIRSDTYNLDAEAVARFLESSCRADDTGMINISTGGRIKAVMPVHLYGQMADMASFLDLSERYGLHVVEDAAQAIGAETGDGIRAGSKGDIGCLSFFPTKNLGAFGDAGMCVTQSEAFAEKLRILRLHGAKPKYHHAIIGGNFRLDTVQAAVLNVKLEHLDSWTSMRQENAAYYSKCLQELQVPVKTPVVQAGFHHIYNQYVIDCPDRDQLQAFLRDKGIGTAVYYPVPLHLQECFKSFGYKAGDCEIAERAAKRTLALPIYPELSREQQDYVVESIDQFYRQR